MEWYWSFALLVGGLIFLLMLGLPVVFAFFTINIVGAFFFLNQEAGLRLVVNNAFDGIASFALAPIPLFLLMGEVMFHTGLAQRAIDAVDRLIARVPGRLSLVAVTGGTIFSALSGSTIANTAMLGSTLMPEMRRRGYDAKIAMGPILGTGGIAMLIPPSALAVLLASLGGISVAQLLIAGIIPGLVMAALFFAYVVLACVVRPELAPSYEIAPAPLWERIRPFLIYVLPLLTIFVIVVGSILGGYATPTESAGLGSVATFAIAIGYRRLTWKALVVSMRETAKISVMILFIIGASLTFSQILASSGATDGLIALVQPQELSPTVLIVAMLAILLLLGAFMDQVSMMMITLPLYMPMVAVAGIDEVWFGVMMLILLEISFTTPPFGLLLFVMKGVVPDDITMREIYLAAAPFILLMVLVVALIFVYPPFATWLPGMLN